MAKISLCQEIKSYKNGNPYAFEKIREKMQPCIRKYSRNLFRIDPEDAAQELSISLYQALQSIRDISNEGQCLTYLSNSLYYCFCNLYKESNKRYINEFSTDYYNIIVPDRTARSTFENLELLSDLMAALKQVKNLKQKKIIIMSFIGQYTDSEIGQALGVSRQYVNRIKKSFCKKYLE